MIEPTVNAEVSLDEMSIDELRGLEAGVTAYAIKTSGDFEKHKCLPDTIKNCLFCSNRFEVMNEAIAHMDAVRATIQKQYDAMHVFV